MYINDIHLTGKPLIVPWLFLRKLLHPDATPNPPVAAGGGGERQIDPRRPVPCSLGCTSLRHHFPPCFPPLLDRL